MTEEITEQPKPVHSADEPQEAAAPAAAASTPPAKTSPGHKHQKTAGEIIHREFTYRGVDWGLNSALSVAFALAVRRTQTGYDIWHKYVGGFFKNVLGMFIKNEKVLGQSVEGSKDFISILVGGTLIIPLIEILENKKIKKSLVKTFDRWIYGKERVKDDPRFAEAYEAIEREPKKDFWTGMGARMLALAPMYTIMSFKSTGGAWFAENYYPKIATVTKGIAEGVGIRPKPGGWWKKIDPEIHHEHIFGKKVDRNNWEFMHYMIGYDFGMTIFYSILHEIAYNFLSRSKHDKKERHLERREESLIHDKPGQTVASKVESPDQPEKSDDKPAPEKPKPVISHVSREAHQAQVAQVVQVSS